ncbi:MAG: hypothetical protein ACLTAI_13580 [Thomasclavelia sp.]
MIITTETQFSLGEVLPYKEKLEEIYNTVTQGHYHIQFVEEDEYQKIYPTKK